MNYIFYGRALTVPSVLCQNLGDENQKRPLNLRVTYNTDIRASPFTDVSLNSLCSDPELVAGPKRNIAKRLRLLGIDESPGV
jgi:hypothetical protein